MAECASYAAGVVCCCGQPGRRQAHLLAAEIRRGLFTTAAHATDIQTRAGTYRARHTVGRDTVPLTMTLSNALQQALAEIEVITALAARTALPGTAEHAGPSPYGQDEADDLLVIDGPLRNRAHLPRAMGLIKTHRAGYLAPELNQVVAALTSACHMQCGQRTEPFGPWMLISGCCARWFPLCSREPGALVPAGSGGSRCTGTGRCYWCRPLP
jgi:hypothetical protein